MLTGVTSYYMGSWNACNLQNRSLHVTESCTLNQ